MISSPFSGFGGKVIGSLRRFPAGVMFVVLLAAALLSIVHKETPIGDAARFFIIYYPATAVLLNMSLSLSAEGRGHPAGVVGKRGRVLLSYIAANALWLAACLAYVAHWPLDVSWEISAWVLAGAMFVGIFLAPFFRRGRDDMGFWTFVCDTVSAMAVSAVVGGLLVGGVELLVLAVDKLFDVSVSWRAYADVAVICLSLVTPLLFLQIVPKPNEDGRLDVGLGKTGLGLVHFLYMPLLGAYLFLLYAYAVKILISWEFPRGWIATLTTVSMLGVVGLAFFLYPVRLGAVPKGTRASATAFDKKIIQWLPAVFLPMLVLMSVGIARRVWEYGITIPRLYLIIFNLWCYAVCIALVVTKGRMIWWLPASFVAVAMVTSVGPWNVGAMTRRVLSGQVEADMSSGIGHMRDNPAVCELFEDAVLPLSIGQYEALMEHSDPAYAARLDDKLNYLFYTYPESVSRKFVDESVSGSVLGSWGNEHRKRMRED